jgi:hypothetical protein
MASEIVCTPKSLPPELQIEAAKTASEINPVNHAPVERLARVLPGYVPKPEHIAVLTTRYWGAGGVRLTVGFLDKPQAELKSRILANMNAWSRCCHVAFVEAHTDPEVRITRAGGPEGGYWSYLGTDIKHIPAGQPTMNLEAFSMSTPESEFHRVVRHETGHTIGCPHEHMRKELVDLIDGQKAVDYFMSTQGWSREEVIAQILTPIEESALMGTAHADPHSIMCYQIPGSLTKNGKPIVGGTDITALDCSFMAKIYPRQKAMVEAGA